MKITASENYYHDYGCELKDCERLYCRVHRKLWRDCDTAIGTRDGAGGHWWDLQDCPDCMAEESRKYGGMR